MNGNRHDLQNLNSGGEEELSSVTLTVQLNSGYNDIRMGNNYGWAPNVDRFTLTKTENIGK